MEKAKKNPKSFGMKLASDEIWQFISTSETSEWLDKLCATMELDEFTGSDGNKILFLKNLSDESNIIKSLNLNRIHLLNKGPLSVYKCQSTLHMICEIQNKDYPEANILFKWVQSVFPLYYKVLSQGGLPLHAALIEREGIGIAISAPGGTGKSTCARRIPLPWKAMCDDEVLIVHDKKDVCHAHPFPTWSRCNTLEVGETWNVQGHVPISAIFFLKQSQKDEVSLLSFSQAAVLIYKLSLSVFLRILGSVDKDEDTIIKKLIFKNACDIAEKIPAFILEASLNGKFWEAIDTALSTDAKEVCVDARIESSIY
ncbi:MAG: SynChlorMet cassette protein ScmC [Clostridiales bacterium]